jgi:hypothetical protein
MAGMSPEPATAGVPDILVQPQNRLDMPPSELESLAQALRPHDLGQEVRILPGYEQRGYGWVKTADEILAKAGRTTQADSGARH